MTDKREIASQDSTGVEATEREPGVVLIPPADVFEDADGITLQLDMPGVARDRLNLQTDRNSLLIEGTAQLDMPQGMAALYADVRSTFYRRSFVLSDELQTDKTEANLKDGILTVRIPKRAEVRPRRIEVRSD